jgi:hypothetical protein
MTVPDDFEEFHMENLDRVKYGSTYAINNMGSLFFVFIFLCIQGFFLVVLKPWAQAYPHSWLKTQQKYSKALFWNSYLRIILEASLDVAIASFYNIRIYQKVEDWYMPDLPFWWINQITLYGTVFALFVGPIWLLVFYLCRFKEWETPAFEEKYGAVLDGLKKDQRSSLFYPVFFMVRRVLFVYFGVWVCF